MSVGRNVGGYKCRWESEPKHRIETIYTILTIIQETQTKLEKCHINGISTKTLKAQIDNTADSLSLYSKRRFLRTAQTHVTVIMVCYIT